MTDLQKDDGPYITPQQLSLAVLLTHETLNSICHDLLLVDQIRLQQNLEEEKKIAIEEELSNIPSDGTDNYGSIDY
jgi:hypothetical protein